MRGLVRKVMGIPEPTDMGTAAPVAPLPAPAPAPAAEKALTQYAGMSATERRMKAAGLKDGGPVRGPGTGTSDSIETEVRPGSYIMPADSTAQLGEDGVAALGFSPEKVPVNLSDGEYKMPPEQVHAVGVQALDAIKGATHTPVAEARGFAPETPEPPVFFANGGEVEDPEKRARQAGAGNPGIRYEEQQPGIGLLMRSQAAAPAAAPVAPESNPLAQTQGAAFGVFRREPTAGTRGGMMQPYVATGPATFEPAKVQDGTGRLDAFSDPRSTLYRGSEAAGTAPTSRGFAGVGEGWGSGAHPAAASPAPAPTARPAVQAPVAAPAVAAAPADQPTASGVPSATQVLPGVFRQGNSYGDSPAAAAAGFAPRSAPSEQNMAAADALEARGIAERAAERSMGAAGGRGFQPGGVAVINAEPLGFSSPAERAQRRMLEAATTPYAGSPNGQLTANQLRTVAGLQEAANRDATARYTADQSTGTQLAATQMREAGDNQRAAASNAIAQGRLDLETTSQGFRTRAARDEEALRRTMMDPQASVSDRAKAQQSLLAMQGKVAPNEWSLHVTPTTKNVDGSTSEGSAMKINRATGEVVRVDQGQGGPLPPIAQNPQALAIKNNASMSVEQKRAALQKLGYN